MSAERQRRLEELFLLATELLGASASERAAFLARHCAGDAGLRAELEALLRADAEHGSALPPPLEAAPALLDAGLPERVGPFRLVRPIGAGGMGTVWLARQEQPLRRTVALKFLRADAGDEELCARFEDERQTLARLEHPGIARVLDGGTVEGRPWFAMEYARGVPIDAFCEREGLGVDARLRLVRGLCDAVQHAHSRGVVHRDIKPANVLVVRGDGRIRAKLIDFGIAAARGARGAAAGTAATMSPEQADPASAVDARSDVWGLGAVLLRLLTGAAPLDEDRLAGLTLTQVAAELRSAPAPVASQLARTPALRRRLRGDLDAVVARALARRPDRRYGTAAELGEDLRRHLQHEPLAAMPADFLYRLRKGLRRHRLAAAALAALLLALVGGGLAARHQAREADRQRAVARREARGQRHIARFLADTLALADPSITLDPNVTVRMLLDSAGERVAGAFGGSPESEAIVRRTLGEAYKSIGELAEAERHLLRSLELQEHGPATARDELYATLWSLVEVYDEAHSRKAVEVGLRAFYLRLEWLQDSLPAVAARLEQLYGSFVAGARDLGASELPAVLAAAEARLAPADPLRVVLADAVGDMGFVLRARARHDEALPFLDAAVELLEELLPHGHPTCARYEGWRIGALLDGGHHRRAEERLEAFLARYASVLPEGHWMLLEARSRLGECLAVRGRGADAARLLAESHAQLGAARSRSERARLEAGLRRLRYGRRGGGASPDPPDGLPDELMGELMGELARELAFSSIQPQPWADRALVFGPGLRGLVEPMDALVGLWQDPSADPGALAAAVEDVVAARDRLLAPGEPHAVLVAQQLGELATADDPRRAGLIRRLAGECLGELRRHGPRLEFLVADVLHAAGVARHRLGDPRAAEGALREALAAKHGLYGRLASTTRASASALGLALIDQTRTAEARRLFEALPPSGCTARALEQPLVAELEQRIAALD